MKSAGKVSAELAAGVPKQGQLASADFLEQTLGAAR